VRSDEEALVAAIRARPDDDEPRLVYADWLSERGDRRGKIIVLALELARATTRPPFDPRPERLATLRVPKTLTDFRQQPALPCDRGTVISIT
jgi:uncharacterized protein (TIGR02996 family)